MGKGGVCHISTVHRADDVRIFHKQCRTLASHGFDVYLVVRAEENKIVGSVRIEALPHVHTRYARVTKLYWHAMTRALRTGAGLFHLHDPELIPLGLVFKALGKKVIYDAHEDLPKQVMSKHWIPKSLRRPVALVAAIAERLAARFFDSVIVATPSIAENFPGGKAVVVQNYPVLENGFLDQTAAYEGRSHKIIYAGGISLVRGAREMVQAIDRIESFPNARLVLAGRFETPSLEEELKASPGWRRVEYLGWVSREELTRQMVESRIGLVLFHPEPNHINSQPNKLFEYMAAGLPVVASNFPMWEDLISETGGGLVVDPLDVQGIANAIAWLLDHPREAAEMGRRGRRAVLERFNWSAEAKKLVGLYERLLG